MMVHVSFNGNFSQSNLIIDTQRLNLVRIWFQLNGLLCEKSLQIWYSEKEVFFFEEPFIILFLIYGNEHLYQLNSEYAVVKEPLMSM